MDPIRPLSDRCAGVPFRTRLQQVGCGVLLVACLAGSPWAADQAGRSGPVPGPNDRQITLAVKSYLEREHFLRHPIDDEIAARWFDTFLEALDPQKVYFLQADVDAFAAKKTLLDDLVRRGDVSFAYEVYDRFLQRVDERLPWVEQLLDTTLDFNRNESIETDPDETHWAQSPDEAKDKWRKRIKYDLLVQEMEKTPEKEAKAKLKRRYRSFAKRMHQTNADELLEIYLVSLTSSLDPHTSFMSPGTLENFEISMRLQLDGIGASLKSEDGYTTVAELVPGGAADKDGRLKKKDRIVGVGQGREGEVVDVVEMNLNDVVKLIRGERGSVVRLKVIPVGQTVPQVYDIVRAKIELQDSAARGEVIEQGQKPDGTPWRIGVINLQGRVFMRAIDCPFRVADMLLEQIQGAVTFVDIHAEATSEKIAMGWYLDGRVAAVVGSHTHVQTADERVLPGGAAYITDAGMTGSFDSVIGIEKEAIINRFLTGIPNRFNQAKDDVRLSGVVVSIDTRTRKAVGITRVVRPMRTGGP